MRVDELVGTPADQQGSASGVGSLPPLSNSGAQTKQQMSNMNSQQAGAGNGQSMGQPDANSPQTQKAKQQQKKQIQTQIKSTQQQLKQLQQQLASIK